MLEAGSVRVAPTLLIRSMEPGDWPNIHEENPNTIAATRKDCQLQALRRSCLPALAHLLR